MLLVKPETVLSSVIDNEPSVIPVLNRFGIGLGTGDVSVARICREKHLDTEFFLAIVNTFINESYFPEHKLREFDATEIAAYLEETNNYYSQFQLSNIERHFRLLMQSVGADSNIHLLLDFFHELRDMILQRVQTDRRLVFPALNGQPVPDEMAEFVASMAETDAGIADRLSDLKSMFVKHLRGTCDNNLLYAVIVAIITLEKDIRQNNRIRARLLCPLLKAAINSAE